MRAAEGASVFCSSDNIATSVFKLFPSHPRLPIFQRAVLRRSPLVLDWPVDEMLGTRKIVVAWAGHTAHAPPPPPSLPLVRLGPGGADSFREPTCNNGVSVTSAY